ncbi:MAG TPA: hypothetical protein VMG55_02960 [Stellaceae bacterium]|nr:hypothetical protein [Stellaceae bacterium]
MDIRHEQLKGLLDALPTAEAVSLARKVETQRALGLSELPADAILAALRPQLRRVRPARIPTLCRLGCAGFEDFLIDASDERRLPGLIPRASIGLWWQALARFAPQEIRTYATELARLAPVNDRTGLDRLGESLRRSARGWTEAVLAQAESRKLTDADARKALADPGVQTDFTEIAHILGIAEPLRQALEAVSAAAARSGNKEGRRICELASEAVSEAKLQYLRFSETHGLDSRYVAIGILNRLARPWEILRLGRALSWKPTDALMRDTELGIIGQRLIRDLEMQVRAVAELAPQRRRGSGAAVDFPRLQQALLQYIESVEGMLGEFGFRRDSHWGEQILSTRAILSRALGPSQLTEVAETALAVLPLRRGISTRGLASDDPDLDAIPSAETVEQALRAAGFLMLLAQKGERHGLSSPARATIEGIGDEIDNRTNRLFEELSARPEHGAAASQIAATVRIAETLFEDDRAQTLSRRFKNMQRSAVA